MNGEQIIARVKIGRTTGKDKSPGSTRQFTVPAVIARNMPEGALFDVVLLEEGILYRFVADPSRPLVDLPEWLKDGA